MVTWLEAAPPTLSAMGVTADARGLTPITRPSRNHRCTQVYTDKTALSYWHYRIAMVTWLDAAPPTLSAMGTASPVGAVAGIWTLTW